MNLSFKKAYNGRVTFKVTQGHGKFRNSIGCISETVQDRR